MSQRIRRVVLSEPLKAGPITDADVPLVVRHHYEDGWVAVSDTFHWTDWQFVGRSEDRDPTYSAEYDYERRTLFHVPLKALHPHRVLRITEERKLVRQWVDLDKGPMAEVVRTETRTVSV